MPLLRVGPPRARRRALGIRAASTASGNPQRLLDLADDPVRRIEELGVHLVPAADVADLEELRARWELLLVLAQNVHVDWAEAVVGPDGLSGRRVQPVDELRRLRLVAGVHGGERSLDLQRRLRDRVEDRLALRLRVFRVALVGEQDVTLAREERVQRVAAARVLRDVVLEELLQIGDRLLVRLP